MALKKSGKKDPVRDAMEKANRVIASGKVGEGKTVVVKGTNVNGHPMIVKHATASEYIAAHSNYKGDGVSGYSTRAKLSVGGKLGPANIGQELTSAVLSKTAKGSSGGSSSSGHSGG